MIKLEVTHGDIFDGPCDLIVLPCSTGGSVTSFVSNYIKGFNIPYPTINLDIGKVKIVPFKGGESIAQYVAYAASVDTKRTLAGITIKDTTMYSVKCIVKSIAEFCMENENIQLINIPLLGTGAGNLLPLLSYEGILNGINEGVKPNQRVIFRLCILEKSIYNTIISKNADGDESEINNPRVFISYTGKDPFNKEWVRELFRNLRKNGVEARMDEFHMRPGMDLPQWMTNEVINAEKVLLVCDSHYMEKADNRHGGVGWETMIIQGDMLRHGENKIKYIAIVREEAVDNGLPIFMKTKLSFHWPKGKNIEQSEMKKLILELFEREYVTPVGKIPTYVKNGKRSKHVSGMGSK